MLENQYKYVFVSYTLDVVVAARHFLIKSRYFSRNKPDIELVLQLIWLLIAASGVAKLIWRSRFPFF